MRKSFLLLGAAALSVAGCDDPVAPIARPEGLFYVLDASGDPLAPAGVLLTWSAVADQDLEVYNVYSRLSGSNVFDLRGSTTSTSYHDFGIPDLEYYVTAVNRNGEESDPSETVFIDERLRLESPASLASTTLSGAVHLAWEDNAFLNEPEGFLHYRVYSASFSIDEPDCTVADDWSLEGTTVAPEFLVGALPNGSSRCFAVAAESIEGWESLWSSSVFDTPRPDARNVLVTPAEQDVAFAGFRFFDDFDQDGVPSPNELGIVRRGDAATIDFRVFRDGAGVVFLEPVRAGTRIALYDAQPIDDLTAIDVAPLTGFSRTAISAEPGFGYVVEMDGGDGFLRFGGLRVTHASPAFVIFDWSFQGDPGNPELQVRGGLPTHGLTVRGVR